MFNMRQYRDMLNDNNIHVIYSGSIWSGGIDAIADVIQKHLELNGVPLSASQSVFSIFIEQINNIIMYSAEKELKSDQNGNKVELSKGDFILGIRDTTYFIQSGNPVTNNSAGILKTRIDHLNTLDKKEIRQYYMERVKAENDNPESKGAGIGLIEIARRSSSPIEYDFEPFNNDLQYFTMYITVEL